MGEQKESEGEGCPFLLRIFMYLNSPTLYKQIKFHTIYSGIPNQI